MHKAPLYIRSIHTYVIYVAMNYIATLHYKYLDPSSVAIATYSYELMIITMQVTSQ